MKWTGYWKHCSRFGIEKQMKLALLSDIHENYYNLLACIEDMRKEGIEQILFLGDFMNAGIARTLATCGIPVHAILGNNDGDVVSLMAESLREQSAMHLEQKTYSRLEIAGRRIFLTHYPDLVPVAVRSTCFDLVCYGHTHECFSAAYGNCLVVNPGELSAHKFGKATYAVYGTEEHTVRIKELTHCITIRTDEVALLYERLGFNQHKSEVDSVSTQC